MVTTVSLLFLSIASSWYPLFELSRGSDAVNLAGMIHCLFRLLGLVGKEGSDGEAVPPPKSTDKTEHTSFHFWNVTLLSLSLLTIFFPHFLHLQLKDCSVKGARQSVLLFLILDVYAESSERWLQKRR